MKVPRITGKKGRAKNKNTANEHQLTMRKSVRISISGNRDIVIVGDGDAGDVDADELDGAASLVLMCAD